MDITRVKTKFTGDALKRFIEAHGFEDNGDHSKALVIFEDMRLSYKEDKESWTLPYEQGRLLFRLANKSILAFPYLFGAVGFFSEDVRFSELSAQVLYEMALKLRSVFYSKKCLKIAKQLGMKDYIEKAEKLIADIKTCSIDVCKPKDSEPKKSPEPPLKDKHKELRSFWVSLDVSTKRNFLIVRIEEFRSFVKEKYGIKARALVEEVLASAKKDRKWKFWICRNKCSKKFSSDADCITHFEQEHAADFKPSSEKNTARRIGEDWAGKILVRGGWEPVDTEAAVELIRNRLEDVKGFVYKNGWSDKWPLAKDKVRSELLKEITLLLVSLCKKEILSCSVRDWVMYFPGRHLENLEVSGQTLVDIHLLETPQSICFLESHELDQILSVLKRIKCERHDGTDQVSIAVASVLSGIRVKEKIDFDSDFSSLLLDKRLLKSCNAPFDDDDGTIDDFDPDRHYAKARVQGDDFISWLVNYSDNKIFPRPIREHNFDIWVSVMKAIQFTCRPLETKYKKKKQLVDYDEALTSVKNECMRRKDLQEDQGNRYASLLCNICEEKVSDILVSGNSLSAMLFLCAVRDVLEEAPHPTIDFPDFKDCLNRICERKNNSDEIVLKSIDFLKSEVNQKILLIDSKILLIDKSRTHLLNDLASLSVFDNRSYILQVLKPFVLNGIDYMQAKIKSDAAEADLLGELVKSQPKKKKNKKVEDVVEGPHLHMPKKKPQSKKGRKKSKGTSTSVSSPLDKIVEDEDELPVSLETEATSPSLKTVGEHSREPEDFLASERESLENSSNTDNLEESAKTGHGCKRASLLTNNLNILLGDCITHIRFICHPQDMKNLPGEDSLLEHLESTLVQAAGRYNSALDMTLKAILNISVFEEGLKQNRQPFHDGLEEQVPPALQDLFSAFLSEEIKDKGVYSVHLSKLLASLEVDHPMSSGAAEVLVDILEFWHCLKNHKRESLVTRLFTLEANERVSCRKCRRMSNYPEETSYGIVLGADSIRDLKCALEIKNFVDIIKVIRLEYKILCDIKTGGCGRINFVHYVISRSPPIFTIVLEWEKNETEEEISETTKAFEWKIDLSRLYEGLKESTNYRLVSLVGCGVEEEEHKCLVYDKRRLYWISLKRESLDREEVVGNWNSMVRYCGVRKIRPQILFYEAN